MIRVLVVGNQIKRLDIVRDNNCCIPALCKVVTPKHPLYTGRTEDRWNIQRRAVWSRRQLELPNQECESNCQGSTPSHKTSFSQLMCLLSPTSWYSSVPVYSCSQCHVFLANMLMWLYMLPANALALCIAWTQSECFLKWSDSWDKCVLVQNIVDRSTSYQLRQWYMGRMCLATELVIRSLFSWHLSSTSEKLHNQLPQWIGNYLCNCCIAKSLASLCRMAECRIWNMFSSVEAG